MATESGSPLKKLKTTDASEGKERSSLTLPIVELSTYFNKEAAPEAYAAECKKAATAFHLYGALNVRDPRVNQEINGNFLDMMERYFEMSDGKRDARPELHYQVGVTPDGIEKARNACPLIGAMTPDNKPLSPCPPEADPKWRFFWKIGERPSETKFQDLNAEPVIPPEIPEWSDTMNLWGGKMIDALFVVAEMVAVGFGLEPNALRSKMRYGPHLLAPTGSNFNRFGKLNTVLAGFHYDLNFMTIHGKSRFPGLYAWLRDGTKAAVSMPDGCLLVQAGKQLELLTGGHVKAGFHEVVVAERTMQRIEAAREQKKSLWRVSSTLFGHIAADETLEPLGHFSTEASRAEYPPVLAGDQVLAELQAIALSKAPATTTE
jgi:isopenicillin N synthase-like dioxygenase